MIYLVRHGEAASGWGQHPDPGLSVKGQAQAIAVASALQKNSIKQTLSSPMQRCQETAAPYAATSQLPLTIEPRVTEIPTPPNVEDRVVWLRNLMSGNWAGTPDLIQSWRANLLKTISALPEETVVFSHFIAINAIVGDIAGDDAVTVFRPNHCSVTKLQPTRSGLVLIEQGQDLVTTVL